MTRRPRRRPFAGPSPHEAFVLVERNPQVVTAACLAVLTVIAAGVTLYVGRAFLLPIATAFVFSVILAPICSRIEWFRMPRPVAALFAMILAGAIAYAGFSLIAEPAARWVQNAPEILHKAQSQITKLQAPLKPLSDISKEMDGLSLVPTTTPKARTVVVEGPGLTQSLLASVQAIAVQAGFVLVLLYFFLVTREDFREKLIAFQPRLHQRVRTARAFRDVENRVGGYIITFSAINIAVGVAVGLSCWGLGLPEPAMWGGIAAILNFIPFLGPAITIGLLGLAGLATFDTLLAASFPVLAYWAINLVESNLVTPHVMGRRMTLNPLAIILSVSFWTWIWGPVGGVISLPLLIMLKVVCDHTPALRALGSMIGAPINRNRAPEEAVRPVPVAEEPLPVAEEVIARAEPYPRPEQAPDQPRLFTSALGATAR
jgi:predicted PurR-regulated permease PerM